MIQANNLCRHKAIIGYLASIKSSSSVEILRDELGLRIEDLPDATVQQYGRLLEKKWSSNLRLQKRVWNISTSQ